MTPADMLGFILASRSSFGISGNLGGLDRSQERRYFE